MTVATDGLTSAEARRRLAADGPNELPRRGRRTLLGIAWGVLREPMLALLLGAGLLYLVLGNPREAAILLVFACLSIVITVVQEGRTEHSLEALRDLTSPRALVLRDGVRRRIAGREVVRGDAVVLSEGDRVPADGWIIHNAGLEVDEALLTGESVPVRKAVGAAPPAAMARPGGDGSPFVYSGTLVVRGTATCTVAATGAGTEIGRIGTGLATIETRSPRLQRQMQLLVWWFAGIGAGACLLAVLLYGLLRGGWIDAVLAGIALGMSMLPEEFPVVLTVFMAMGAMRMAKVHVLTRRAAAIETLGSATVLCTDKTGTLTENRMAIAELRLAGGRRFAGEGEPDADFRALVEAGIRASAEAPVDPMEIAFTRFLPSPPAPRRLLRQYPLSPALLAMTNVWSGEGADAPLLVAAKGAPEAIAALCALSAAERAALQADVDAMAGAGLRVLGVARAEWSGGELPGTQSGFAFAFAGLVGLADPLRASVPAAVRACRAAGIRVVMITGDYPQTAAAIATRAGIAAHAVLTGAALAAMSDAELRERIGTITVCARIMPEQKLRIVEALKAAGEVVAMTGDGVNDAPSLKAADIGIAMGGRGTDVAREAAAIVLLDDEFLSIVHAIRLGRRIYDNLRKAMGFIVSAHIPIAGLSLLPLLTGMPLLLGPIHIAFIEMIIDPVCSLAFETEGEEGNVMSRPPRAADAPLFSRWLVAGAVLQGLAVLAVCAGVTLWLWHAGRPPELVRSGAFFALMPGLAGLIVLNRRFGGSLLAGLRQPNPSLLVVLAIVATVLVATQLVPPVAGLFHFARVPLRDLAVIAGLNLALLFALEALKPLWQRADR